MAVEIIVHFFIYSLYFKFMFQIKIQKIHRLKKDRKKKNRINFIKLNK